MTPALLSDISLRLWRVFPWDSEARPGMPFSATALPRHQGSGRFDIPHITPVRYLAESPENAVGERIQTFRGQRLTDRNLKWGGRPLALIGATIATPAPGEPDIIDLCDPQALVTHDCRPDMLASSDLIRTQVISAQLYATGALGFRWWSALRGDWHTIVLFVNRITPIVLQWDDTPEPLTISHAAVRSAALTLGVLLEPAVELESK